MRLSDPRMGERVVLVGGILLIINLFVPWWLRWSPGPSNADWDPVSWGAFDVGFLAWFGSLCAIAAAVIVALKTFANVAIDLGPLSSLRLALILGGLGFLMILACLVANAELLFVGVLVGLVATAAVTYGALLLSRQEPPPKSQGRGQP